MRVKLVKLKKLNLLALSKRTLSLASLTRSEGYSFCCYIDQGRFYCTWDIRSGLLGVRQTAPTPTLTLIVH
jgi:hypothetical protein